MDVSIYMKGDYEDLSGFWLRKNKANQTQWPGFGRKLEALHRESLGRNPKSETRRVGRNSPAWRFCAGFTP
jgi:hypothetical protein